MKTLTIFQKILLGFPVALYIMVVAYLSLHIKGDALAFAIFFMVVLLLGSVVLLLPAVIIHTISSYRISVAGAYIMVLWPGFIACLLWMALFLGKDTTHYSHPSAMSWSTEYTGKEKIIYDAGTAFIRKEYTVDSLQVSHYEVIKKLEDSTSLYAFYFFYDQYYDILLSKNPRAIVMLIDDSGHERMHWKIDALYDPFTARIYYHEIARLKILNKITLSDHAQKAVDTLGDSLHAIMDTTDRDTIRYNDVWKVYH